MKKTGASLRKNDRLCGVRAVSELFARGKTMVIPPLKVIFLLMPEDDLISPARVLVSVPGKQFRKAVDRNLIRRRIKESWRLNMLPLKEKMTASGRRIDLAIIWIDPEIGSYETTEKCVRRIIERLTHLKY
jgi:ribonuclease P protein component